VKKANINLEDDLAERVEAYAADMERAHRGLTVSFNKAVQMLLHRGLEAVAAEKAAPARTPAPVVLPMPAGLPPLVLPAAPIPWTPTGVAAYAAPFAGPPEDVGASDVTWTGGAGVQQTLPGEEGGDTPRPAGGSARPGRGRVHV